MGADRTHLSEIASSTLERPATVDMWAKRSIADALGIRTGGEPWWRKAACAGQPWSVFFFQGLLSPAALISMIYLCCDGITVDPPTGS